MAAPTDTIFALASGALPSAIALVRLSGPGAFEIGRQLCRGGLPAHKQAKLVQTVSQNGAVIDQAVATVFQAPNSYTGEDTLELSLHGGRYVVEQVFEALLKLGARLAEPGEFTRRAFEAGKLDLTQAEAVADLIDAETQAQHELALKQLGGALSEVYDTWHDQLVKALAALEVFIDFPDEGDVGNVETGPALNILEALTCDLEETLKRSEGAERVRDGFLVAILGAPNAGKSSLLNTLAGHEAAIVTDIAGTTRDFVEVKMRVGPHLVRFSDTAGLRQTEDKVEKIGIERTRTRASEADIRIWLAPVGEDWPKGAISGPRDILVRSKSDLISNIRPSSVSRETIFLSSLTGDGLVDLRSALDSKLSDIIKPGQTPGLTQLRHRVAIEDALFSLKAAIQMLQNGDDFELAAEDVRFAARKIASLTGRIDVEEVLGSIFSDFCIGK